MPTHWLKLDYDNCYNLGWTDTIVHQRTEQFSKKYFFSNGGSYWGWPPLRSRKLSQPARQPSDRCQNWTFEMFIFLSHCVSLCRTVLPRLSRQPSNKVQLIFIYIQKTSASRLHHQYLGWLLHHHHHHHQSPLQSGDKVNISTTL